MSIRLATEQDIPRLIEIGAAMHAESPRYNKFSYDPDVYAAFLAGMIGDPATGCYFVSEGEGGIRGFFGAKVCPLFFSATGIYSCDTGLYVLPEHRGKKDAVALIKAYEQWAAGKGVLREDILLAISYGSPESVHEFFIKMGYSCIGKLYGREV